LLTGILVHGGSTVLDAHVKLHRKMESVTHAGNSFGSGLMMLEICPRCGFREIDDDETGWCSRCAGVRVTDSYQERKLNERRQRWLEWLADRRTG
jgi:hypothetical protein